MSIFLPHPKNILMLPSRWPASGILKMRCRVHRESNTEESKQHCWLINQVGTVRLQNTLLLWRKKKEISGNVISQTKTRFMPVSLNSEMTNYPKWLHYTLNTSIFQIIANTTPRTENKKMYSKTGATSTRVTIQ